MVASFVLKEWDILLQAISDGSYAHWSGNKKEEFVTKIKTLKNFIDGYMGRVSLYLKYSEELSNCSADISKIRELEKEYIDAKNKYRAMQECPAGTYTDKELSDAQGAPGPISSEKYWLSESVRNRTNDIIESINNVLTEF